MFYIKDFVFRFQYFIFSFLTTLFLCCYYKKIVILILNISLLNSVEGISNFIYTHPTELLTTYFIIVFIFTLFISIPYLFWSFLDFNKCSLRIKEYSQLKIILTAVYFYFFVFNFFLFFFFSKYLGFFVNFNSFDASDTLNFYFELSISNFFSFFVNFLFYINFYLFILGFLLSIVRILGVKVFLYWKKFFVFVNILLATLLSPPDIYSQLVILVILSFFFLNF